MPPKFVVAAGGLVAVAAMLLAPCKTRGDVLVDELKRDDTVYVSVDSAELMVGYKTLKLLSLGAPLKVLSLQDDWVQVSAGTGENAIRGWVRAGKLTHEKPAAKTEDSGKEAEPKAADAAASTPSAANQEHGSKDETGSGEAATEKGLPAASAAKKPAESLADKFQQMLADPDQPLQSAQSVTAETKQASQLKTASAQKATEPQTKTPAVPSEAPASASEKVPDKPLAQPAPEAAPGSAAAAPLLEPEQQADQPEKPATQPEKPAAQPEKKADGAAATSKEDPKTESEVAAAKTVAPPDEEELPEGPEALAQKFAEILAKRRSQGDVEVAPPAKVEEKVVPKKAIPAPPRPPKPVVPAADVPTDLPPTIDVLLLRIGDDLADIQESDRIGKLVLSGEQFTNRVLRDLAGLSVSTLSIEAINVSNAGMQYVKDVHGVRTLRLWSPGIDDSALTFLAQLSDLEVLDIEGTAIEGTTFAELKNAQKLETLILGPKVSDATVANLKDLPALRQLDLRSCGKLSLACLESLANLTNLRVVWLPRHLRTKGKRALKITLPECQVRS